MFNVTLTRNADVAGWQEEGGDNDNSTVVHATVEYIGIRKNRLGSICCLEYTGGVGFLAEHGRVIPPVHPRLQ